MNEEGSSGKRDRIRREYESLFGIGLGTAAVVLTLLSGKEKLKAVFTSLSAGTLTFHTVLPTVLFLQTILLGIAWYVSGKHEFSLLAKYYGRHVPERSFVTLPLVIFVATMVVILSYFSADILVYSSLYAVYLMFAVVAGWLSSQNVLKAINDGRLDSTIPSSYRDEVYKYYVSRPSPILGYICGAITFLSITMALLEKHTVVPAEREHFETVAYVAMISSILISEVTVWWWRARLYRKTRDL